jgi:hypothetical protein
MAEPELTPEPPVPLRLPLPAEFTVDPTEPLRYSPKELKVLRAQTGQSFTEMMQADPFTLIAWFRMRREGWPELRYPDLEANVMIVVQEQEADGPLLEQPPTGWPDSAGTGG